MMIKLPALTTDIQIDTLSDLVKLRPLMENKEIKINKSQIARELNVDRRTVGKYINGYHKPTTRRSKNCISEFERLIHELLDPTGTQVFYYKRVLWQYLKDNHGYEGSYGNFCHYINQNPDFGAYFRKQHGRNVEGTSIRYETPPGKQAQIDWKESIKLLTSKGDSLEVNVFVLLMSYSRFRIYRLSLSKTQDVLFTFLDDAFEQLGGVPHTLLTDNMTTVMTEARTKRSDGKVNEAFAQFAKDYGFEVQPCAAGSPKTKGKVESPMRILDELRAYSGKLDYEGFQDLLYRINERENAKVNRGSGKIPLMYLPREKEALKPLPPMTVRKPYQMVNHVAKVNHSSMFYYQSCQYSVHPKYIGEKVRLQVYDGYVHVYCKKELIAIHKKSTQNLNYNREHYMAIARKSHAFKEENIEERAKENLRILGEKYEHE